MNAHRFALALALLVSAPAAAQQIAVERLYDRNGWPAALVSVTNDRAAAGYKMIMISCVFTKGGKVMGQASGIISNLAYGQRDADHVFDTNLRFDQVDAVQCRIVQTM